MDLEVFGIFLTLADKFSGKVWPIIIVIIYIFAEFYSLKCRKFYATFSPIIKLLHSFNDLLLLHCNTYLILGLNFWKKSQWSEFWANLKLVKGRRMGKKSYYLGLFFANLIYALTLSYVIFYWCQEYQASFFQRYVVQLRIVRVIDNYCIFWYKYFVCTLLVVLASRYQKLKTQLKNHHLKTVAYGMTIQKKNLQLFNEIFGIPIFLIIVQSMVHTLEHLSDFIYNYQTFEEISVIVVTLLVLHIPTMILIFLCGHVMEERRKIVMITYEINPTFKQKKKKLPGIVDLIRKTEIKITAANFFVLDKSTILAVLDTIVASVIVLAQFKTDQ
ncbi:gustatory receptor 51 [Tribolium castaneum]|uniref:Gustatory receptor n=1 Tax=Tribolium castaneum TaxID=7070 RepID=D2A4L4_TRICA|nr:gustatory receptor 51 [Tribolium castaneum]